MESTANFFDDLGYLHAEPDIFNSENAVLYTVILNEFKTVPNIRYILKDYINHCSDDVEDDRYKLSLDNLNGLALAVSRGIILKSEFKEAYDKCDLLTKLRPDNLYTWSKALDRNLLAAIVRPLAYAMMRGSCRKYLDKKPRGEGENRHYINEPATSGKIQVWVRLRANPDNKFAAVCTDLVEANFFSWAEVFIIYFHPLSPILKHGDYTFGLQKWEG